MNPHHPHHSQTQATPEEMHLSEMDLARYVEARLQNISPTIDTQKEKHLEDCPACQQEIMERFLAQKALEKPIEKKGIHRSIRPLLRIAGVFLIATALMMTYILTFTPKNVVAKSWFSPFKQNEIDVSFQEWNLQAHEAKTIYLSNGSYFRLPANTFVNVGGEEVKGNIRISYREIRSISDLLASGIPTQYDSLGKEYTLATLGMFELRAWQGNEALKIASNKIIEVNMLTNDASNAYSHYQLLEKDGKQIVATLPSFVSVAYAKESTAKWHYLSPSVMKCDTLNPNVSKQTLLNTKKQTLNELEQTLNKTQEEEEKQYTAQRNNTDKDLLKKNDTNFQLRLNETDHPGLARYKQTVWEYAGENKQDNPNINHKWALQEKWDEVHTNQQKYRPLSLKGHNGVVLSAVFSPNANYVLTASADQTAKVWTKDAQYLFTITGHSGTVNSAVFSPNGEQILTASEDHTARVWNKSGNRLFALKAHTAGVRYATYSPNGKYILTTGNDKIAILWSNEGEEVFRYKHYQSSFPAQFSPDGKKILLITSSTQAEVWQVEGNKKLNTLNGNFATARFSALGEFILTTANGYGKAIVWNEETGKVSRELDLNDADAFFLPDDGHILSLTNATARIWHWNKHKPNSTVLLRNMQNNPSERRDGHTSAIRNVTFSNDGQWIMTASSDQTARIWNKNGQVVYTLREHKAPINMLNVSPNGNQLVTASDDFTAKIWTEKENQEVVELELIKHSRKFLDESGQRREIKGRKFYTQVRIKGETIEEDSPKNLVVVRQKETESEEKASILLEKYERTLAECKALEKLPKGVSNQKQICFRQFRVHTLGAYACAKPVLNTQKGTYTVALQSEDVPSKSLQLYRASQEGDAVILQSIKNKDIRLAIQDKLVILFPNDRMATYSSEEASRDCSKNSTTCQLKVEAKAQLFAKKDLDLVFKYNE